MPQIKEIGMKKGLKKAVAVLLAMFTLTGFNIQSFADDICSNELNGEVLIDNEKYVLLSESTATIEEGVICRTQVYQKSDEVGQYSVNSSRGSKTIKVENDFIVSKTGTKTLWATITIGGKFSWDSQNDTVTVTNVSHNVITNTGRFFQVLNNPAVEYGDNQGANFLFGRKYAYIKKELTMTNGYANSQQTFSLYVDVNIDGHHSYTPSTAHITIN